MSIFIGKAEMLKTPNGKTYMRGWFGKIPILGYFDHKDQNIIHFTIDEKTVADMSKKNDNYKKQQASLIRDYRRGI